MKIYVICIGLLLSCLTITAQTNYYNVDRTFVENGYTYQCDVLKGAKFVRLYNKENKFTYVEQIDKNTKDMISIKENMQEKQLEDDSWTKQKCYSIINSAFSSTEKQRIKDWEFTVMLYVDPDTGKVSEVGFQFFSNTPYGFIPVSVFRQIEVELKKNIWFVPTQQGKRRNYILVGWLHEVK